MDNLECPDGFSRQAIERFAAVQATGSAQEIAKAKCNLLLDSATLFGIVMNYLVLEKNGINFDFGQSIIKAGTALYRISKYDKDTDFSDLS